MKYYIIPEKDIENLEKARAGFYRIMEIKDIHLALTMDITQPMYQITHRRYPRALFPKLLNKLAYHKLWRKR